MRTIIRDNYTPTPGDYHEKIVRDEVNDKQWIFDCDGVVTDITGNGGVVVVNELGPSTTAATSQALVTEELGKKQDSLSEEQMGAVNSGIDAAKVAQIATNTANITAETSARTAADTAIRNDLTALTGRVTTTEGDIDTIEDKIPAQATAQNQLADKNFVNSSIATNTANFIGTFNSVAELEAYTGTVTNNDYAFVIVTDAQGNTAYDRYKYNGDTEQWMFEYELNNSSFTAEQWAAINSGITSGNVDKLTGLANIKSIGANLSLSQAGELSATGTTYTAGNGLNLNGTQFSVDTTTIATQSDLTTGLATKQDTLTAGDNIQINGTTVSATNTGLARTLSSADYNYPQSNPDGIASWKLPAGTYVKPANIKIYQNNSGDAWETNYNSVFIKGTNAGAGYYPALMLSQYNTSSRASYRLLAANGADITSYGLKTIISTDEVVDNLTSTSTTHPLSAKQGKLLNEAIPVVTMQTTDPGEGVALAANHFIAVYQ